ncbi:MAG TPA: Calx-beta domain-containing protein [Acidimicrobiales bacterium]|nr:Calx-beta domain-containing protein [Acidimicrobiales bacterium]
MTRSARKRAGVVAVSLALLLAAAAPGSAAPGDPDTTFGNGGTVRDSGAGAEEALAALLLPDGRIVAAGYRVSGGSSDFVLGRYSSSGAVDGSFGVGGHAVTNFGAAGSNDAAQGLARYGDGRLLAAGHTTDGGNADFALARYTAGGGVDTSWDGDGKVTTAFGGGLNDTAYAVVLDGDDAIAVGQSESATDSDIALARYNSNGSLDTGFDGDGRATTDIGGNRDVAHAAVLQSGDKIVVAGYTESATDRDVMVARYNADGTPDSSFDTDGIVVTPLGGADDEARAVAVQPDGKIVVAGLADNGSNDDVAVLRYNANGTLDSGFDGDGIALTGVGASHDRAEGVTVQPDGRVLVAGASSNGDTEDVLMVRYNADGSLDGTFDGDGKLVRGGSDDDAARAVLVQPDTKMVTAGTFDKGSASSLGLMRVLGETVSVDDVQVVVPPRGETSVSFTASLSAPSLETVTVSFATTDGSARSGPDYEGRSGTLSFAPGETSKPVAITVRSSGAVEPDESFSLTLSDAVNASILDGTGIATLLNKKATKYWLVAGDGGIFAFGGAPFRGSTGAIRLNQPVVGMAAHPSGDGYWFVAQDGGIFAFNAPFRGSTGGIRLNRPIVGMASTPSGDGYWLAAQDGGIFAFNAPFRGSTGGIRLNQPVVGVAASTSGTGYWLVAADGGIFAFNAPFHGSTGGIRLNQPIVAMATTPTGNGYWLVARDGGVFAFGDAAFKGSTGGIKLNQPIVGMAATSSGNGYWLFARDGGVFAFGDAQFSGSMGGLPLASPVVGGAGSAQ